MAEDEYPEHIKLKARKEEALTIGNFLDWLEEKDYLICWYEEDSIFPIHDSKERIIGDFLNISPDELDNEKRRMLDKLREGNT